MTLETLLDRALIKTYDRWAYFKDIQLVGDTLLVPNVYRADAINRCFLERLRGAHPALVVKAVTPAPSSAKDAGTIAQGPQKKSAFKKGYVPVQADMFGDGES